MSGPLAEYTGDTLYLDTMIPYALLRGIEPAAKSFFNRVQSGEFVAYTSVLTFDELAYRLLLARIRDAYDRSPLDRLRSDEAAMISEFYPDVAPQLTRLRRFPNFVLIDVSPADLNAMSDAMLQYHIRPRDALHLAAMQKCGCLDLLSNDSDFDRVPLVRRYHLV